MGITPVAYQYGTEKLYPAPEGTSMGLIILSGQISVVVISIMGWMYAQLGDFNLSLLILAGLMVVSAILLSLMKESEMVQQAQVPSYSPTQPGD
jgi:hypothetical protein